MSDQIKYLTYKGLEKKDQILFKSFINLSQNELSYQVEIYSEEHESEGIQPDFVIRDESYEYSDAESVLNSLPTIVVGENTEGPDIYIARPVQWSDFKSALAKVDFDTGAPESDDEEAGERLLPDAFEVEIANMDATKSIGEGESRERSFSDAADYDYELDKMSIDYHSFTNSDYMQVVDDVAGFNESKSEDLQDGLLLVTDEESGSQNSVVIIETNSLDAWEMSESEFEDGDSTSVESGSMMTISVYDEKTREEILKRLDAGKEIALGDQFWSQDQEIFSGKESIMVIKAEREMVYSRKEPAKWASIIKNKTLTRVPLKSDWSPSEKLKAYPISRLQWASTLVTHTQALHPDLSESEEYMLEKWPHFDLLELDNVLLKLCTMLFVGPETAYSLLQKSGYSRVVVYGLLNACYELDILRPASEIPQSQTAAEVGDNGMLGKIKDVFR